MSFLPITLSGDTLGQRHRNLNALVDRAFNSDVKFQEVLSIPEQSPVDRLFKIDLASKLRDVDYIIKNLKGDDMLYVSRALKCRWILGSEYKNVINPEYLEDYLYPYMLTTAVSKMKWWISLRMKDPDRCLQFYKYYFERNFDLSLRFLTHCEVSYIYSELPTILEKVDPFYFKVFCEKSPRVAKLFYDSLVNNEKLLNIYVDSEVGYYNSLKVILKMDGNLFLDITEKYFHYGRFKRLSPIATKFILSNCKERFLKKTELYVAWLLDIKTLAECLTVEECKDVTLLLARAEYLSDWFTYKNVEPLIKRIPPKDRSAFKKKVFVEKDVGEKVKEWQYETPSTPTKKDKSRLFADITHSPYEYASNMNNNFKKMLKKRKYCGYQCADVFTVSKMRTLLDQLFDEFRFMSFEKALYELRKRIAVESSPQNRQFMMLVLVSKSGGRLESIDSLLQLLARHQNEPPHLRATIIRSLVKRAFVWRLPKESWERLLTFAVGLGLDGKEPEANCREGLHAVVLRDLLGSGCIAPELFSAFIREFSTLKEYSLTHVEQKALTERLPALLLASIVNENETEKQSSLFSLLFQTLDDYKLPIDTCPVVPALAALANKDISVARNLILKLFQDKKARRELFEQNFTCISTDDSYLNALRHCSELLKKSEFIKRALDKDSKREQFFRKLSIYFTETHGLAEIYLSAIKESVSAEYDLKHARPLAILIGSNLESYLKQLNNNEDKNVKRFASIFKANAHLARPKMNIEAFGYETIGPKAVANIVQVCRNVDVERHLDTLTKYPRTIRLALILAERLNMESQILSSVVNLRPNAVLKSVMRYFRRNPNSFDQRAWEIIKPIIKNYDFASSKKPHISKILWNVNKIPESIKAEYCTILYEAAKTISDPRATFILCHIENLLPKVSENFVVNILTEFVQTNLALVSESKIEETCLYLRILIKFLLLSKSEEMQMKRYETYAEPILEVITSLKTRLTDYFEEIIKTLRFNIVFFNEDYVSSLPVFENIISWMHKICPMDTCFKYYVEIHLTMVFFKSVRLCLKHNPNMFKDDKTKTKIGVEVLGKTFGTYIAKEVDELKSRYFESIIELYTEILQNYLDNYFFYDTLKETFVINIIRGIVEHGESTTALLGLYLFEKISHLKESEVAKDIISILNLKDVPEIQFFLCNI